MFFVGTIAGYQNNRLSKSTIVTNNHMNLREQLTQIKCPEMDFGSYIYAIVCNNCCCFDILL